jgi:hypothetical protein
MKRKVILGVAVALLAVAMSSFPAAGARTFSVTVSSCEYNANWTSTYDWVGVYNISWEGVHPYLVEIFLTRVSDGKSSFFTTYAPKGKDGKYPQNVSITFGISSNTFNTDDEVMVAVRFLDRKWGVLESHLVTTVTWGTDKTWPAT